MKRCNKCLEEKPLDSFGKHRMTKDGLNWWCRACNIANSKRYIATHQEKVKAYWKRQWQKYKKTHPPKQRKPPLPEGERRRRARNRYRRAYQLDPRKNAIQRSVYRANNLEKVRQQQIVHTAKDRAKHPERWKCRWAVSAAVAKGVLPKVRTLRCTDCGGQASRYDHYLGYSDEHRLHVQPVCSMCDGKREVARGHRRIYA